MTAAFWDGKAETLEEARKIVWSLDNYDVGVTECLQRIVPWVDGMADGSRVLDLGCGIGRLLIPLASLYPKIDFIGLDHSYKMLVYAAAAQHEAGAANVELIQGSLRRLGQLDPVDGVFSFAVLQHVEPYTQRAFVDAVTALLKVGGWFRFQWVAIGGEGDTGPLANPVPVAVMREWVESAGLRVETLELHDGLPTIRWLTARKP